MTALVNTSSYPAFGFEHRLLVGNRYFITVLKQSFKLKPNGKLVELKDQIAIRLQDIVRNDARWDSVRHPSDIIPYKPKPEVILNGVAVSDTPKEKWVCGIDIKQLIKNKTLSTWSKHILVTSERYWLRQGNNWNLSKLEPNTSIELGLENAYGGHFSFKTTEANNKDVSNATADFSYTLNPAGKGWLPSSKYVKKLSKEHLQQLEKQIKHIEVLPAPQLFCINQTSQKIEDLDTPYQTVTTAGFGAYANFWEMRAKYISDDLDWSDESTGGGYPVDFDMRHWQQTPEDQWLDFELKGQEILTLTGFFPEGKQSYTLPTSIAYVVIREPGQLRMKLDMVLDTVIIDTQERTLELVWRRIVLLSHLDPNTVIECNAFITNEFRRL